MNRFSPRLPLRLRARLTQPRLWLALLLVAYALYAAAFIYTTSAVIPASSYAPQSERYFVLFDDMMISMRYARNLANGEGLVWNPGGERVEGYTNPGWVLYMALWHLPGIDDAHISLAIQVSGAVFMLATAVALYGLGRLVSGSALAGLLAGVFTLFYLPHNVWSLQGTEVSALMLITTLAAWWALRDLARERFPARAYLLLGFSTLIRIDMAVPLLALGGFLFFNDARSRWRHALAAPLALAVFAAPQFAFRIWYYDAWLPNTYTLKVDGYPLLLRLLKGLEVTVRLMVRLGPLPLGVFLFRRDRAVRLLAWLFVAQVIYSIYVGGDAWEEMGGANRYQSVAMPLLFLLLALALVSFYRWLMQLARSGAARVTPGALHVGLAVTVVALLFVVNYTATTRQIEESLLLKPSLFAGENRERVEMALLLESLTEDDATVAVAGAGIIPYFADRPTIDLLGKNDPVIAALPADTTVIPEFKPGHMKWDYAYSIGELQPDVVLELWVRPQDAAPYLDAAYHAIWFPPKNGNVWMLRDSDRIRWERIWGE